MLYLSLLGIPFLGNIILARILYEERKENAVHVLLASGISPIIIWLGKMTITFIIVYLVFLISTLIYCLVFLLFFGIPLVLNANLFMITFIVAPLLSFGFLSILGYLFWALKNPQLFGMILPIVFVVGFWNVGMKWGEAIPDSILILASFLLGLFLLALSVLGIRFLSLERITDI